MAHFTALLLTAAVIGLPSPDRDAHTTAALRFITAYRVREAMTQQFRDRIPTIEKTSPKEAAIMRCIVNDIQGGELDFLLIKTAKRHMTVKQLTEVSVFFESSIGNNILDKLFGPIMKAVESGNKDIDPVIRKIPLTPEETRVLQENDKKDSFKAFGNFVNSGLHFLSADPDFRKFIASEKQKCIRDSSN